MDEVEIVRGGTRIPTSSPRNAKQTYAKLLLRVQPRTSSAFSFEGTIVRPGRCVTAAELWPTPEYPPSPIVLEYATSTANGARGHNRKEELYVLWRYDPESREWTELGRALSSSWDWSLDLGPLALRALQQRPEVLPDLSAIERRLADAFARELDPLEARDQWRVLGILHDQLACRVASMDRRALAAAG